MTAALVVPTLQGELQKTARLRDFSARVAKDGLRARRPDRRMRAEWNSWPGPVGPGLGQRNDWFQMTQPP